MALNYEEKWIVAVCVAVAVLLLLGIITCCINYVRSKSARKKQVKELKERDRLELATYQSNGTVYSNPSKVSPTLANYYEGHNNKAGPSGAWPLYSTVRKPGGGKGHARTWSAGTSRLISSSETEYHSSYSVSRQNSKTDSEISLGNRVQGMARGSPTMQRYSTAQVHDDNARHVIRIPKEHVNVVPTPSGEPIIQRNNSFNTIFVKNDSDATRPGISVQRPETADHVTRVDILDHNGVPVRDGLPRNDADIATITRVVI